MVENASPSNHAHAVDDKRDAALGDALKSLFGCGKHRKMKQSGKTKRVTAAQLLHLVRRLLIVVAAVWYVVTSVESSIASLKVLNGARNAPMAFEAYDTNYILKWMGKSAIRHSPFVGKVLQNSTAPRNYTVYLEANDTVSAVGCSTPLFNKRLYSNAFLRLALIGMERDCVYNITDLATYEVILPIVDCSFTPLVRGADTNVRMFFLMRRKLDHDDVVVVATRFNMQDYKVLEMNEHGPFGLANHQYVKDMSLPTVYKTAFTGALGYPFEPARSFVYTFPQLNDQGWWVMTAIPPTAADAPKHVITSSRTGFYISSDSEQANIKNQYWSVDQDPTTALTKWNWKGEPLLRDSWAWVHLLHAWFALDALFNLALLALVIYRNLQKGRIWIGDAFVSISATLLGRGVLILVSWAINGFWALMEFCLHDAHKLAETQEIFIHPVIMRADLLTLFLGLTSMLGYLLRERIDPAVAIVVFEIAFNARLGIVKAFPSVVESITTFARADHNMAILGVSEVVAMSSPLRLWTTHKLPAKQLKFIFSSLMPIFFSLIAVLVYVAARKIYRHFHHDQIYKQSSKATTATAVSEGDEASTVLYKRNLTLFEIATGAELQTRFGVVSDYENCLIIKGMKYASADGIYSNGFVIANGKWLLATDDLVSIALQKLFRVRLRNLYAYEVDGNTVQQRARLVYPETLSWSDLKHLNVTVLS